MVDNNSTDHTPNVVGQFAARLPIRPAKAERMGLSVALNEGLRHARGELIVFTNDDVTPRPDWLLELTAAAGRHPDAGGFGGQCHDVYVGGCPAETLAAMQGIVRLGELDHGPADCPFQPGQAPICANFALRASVLRRLGMGFDERYGPVGQPRVAGTESELILPFRPPGWSSCTSPTPSWPIGSTPSRSPRTCCIAGRWPSAAGWPVRTLSAKAGGGSTCRGSWWVCGWATPRRPPGRGWPDAGAGCGIG